MKIYLCLISVLLTFSTLRSQENLNELAEELCECLEHLELVEDNQFSSCLEDNLSEEIDELIDEAATELYHEDLDAYQLGANYGRALFDKMLCAAIETCEAWALRWIELHDEGLNSIDASSALELLSIQEMEELIERTGMAEAFAAKGVYLMAIRDFDGALDYMNKAINAPGSKDVGYYLGGMIYELLDDLENAEKMYLKADEFNPQDNYKVVISIVRAKIKFE